MNILGINCYVHDSAACLVKDGRVVANVEEERLNRERHTSVFPKLAIAYALKAGGLQLSDIDIVAFNWNPAKALLAECLKFLFLTPVVYFKMLKYNQPPKHFKTIFASFLLRRALRREIGTGFHGKVVWVDHHMAHAASTYYLSSFTDADILVVDGFGEFAATSYLRAVRGRIESRWWMPALDSLGVVYLLMTRFLGFAPFQEGRTMALASYGKASCRGIFQRMIMLTADRYRVDKNYFVWWKLLAGKIDPELGLPRRPGEVLTQRHMDLAAGLQERVTTAVLHILKNTSQSTPNKRLCLAGGLFLNCNINAAIAASGYYERCFIPPFPSDAGGAIGAALHAAFGMGNEHYHPAAEPFSPFLGPEYSADEILRAVSGSGLVYRRVPDPGEVAARAIAEHKVIGYFQGRVESGPRALGARSILANPRDQNIQQYLNTKIKKREFFQPFAPLVTEEAAPRFFALDPSIPSSARYMLLTVEVRPAYREHLPGITHVDGTARVQVLRREWNPRLYALLEEFERLTGFAVVVNTSFNQHEPIVCSPADAIRTFQTARLDLLVMDDIIVSAPASREAASSLGEQSRAI